MGDFPGMPVTTPGQMPQMPNPMAMQAPAQQPNPQVQPAQAAAPQELTLQEVQQRGDEAAQKQSLGEMIFLRVQAFDPVRAGTIVGMIVDVYDVQKLLQVVNDQAFYQETLQKVLQTLDANTNAEEQKS